MKPITLILAVWLASAAPALAVAQPYSLDQLLQLALTSNKGVSATAAGVDAARAGVATAGAYPNPELEFLTGRVSARQAGSATGATQTFSLTQRLDLPSQRHLRQAMAGKTLDATASGQRAFTAELAADVKRAFYETLRSEAEYAASQADLELTQQIYRRAQVRVDVGDAPRYELIRAEAELLNVQKNSQSALLRVNRAKSLLRQQVGDGLPAVFDVRGSLGREPLVRDLAALHALLRTSNAELDQLRNELQRAELAVEHERSLRLPTVSLRAAADREPDVQNTRLGVVVSLPIWDRRKGPIAEASAQAMRIRHLLESREFELMQELDSAYQQYQIASSQVDAFETGIVRQAQTALRVAEAAYRFGERGIIDFLDAQRVLRIARGDLIAALYDLQLAAVDIDRLLANIPTDPNP